jgi:hypothetical protein
MDKDGYRNLFYTALQTAAKNAEKVYQIGVPRTFHIDLLGAGHPQQTLPPESAIDALYISSDQFWLLIDVSIGEINLDGNYTLVHISVTGHGLSTFEHTWNYAKGCGPFKQVIALQLRMTRYAPLPPDFDELVSQIEGC